LSELLDFTETTIVIVLTQKWEPLELVQSNLNNFSLCTEYVFACSLHTLSLVLICKAFTIVREVLTPLCEVSAHTTGGGCTCDDTPTLK